MPRELDRRIDPEKHSELVGIGKKFWDREVALLDELLREPPPEPGPGYARLMAERDRTLLAKMQWLRGLAQATSGAIHPTGHNNKDERREAEELMRQVQKRSQKWRDE